MPKKPLPILNQPTASRAKIKGEKMDQNNIDDKNKKGNVIGIPVHIINQVIKILSKLYEAAQG